MKALLLIDVKGHIDHGQLKLREDIPRKSVFDRSNLLKHPFLGISSPSFKILCSKQQTFHIHVKLYRFIHEFQSRQDVAKSPYRNLSTEMQNLEGGKGVICYISKRIIQC